MAYDVNKDYKTWLQELMGSGASAQEVSNALGERVEKAVNTEGLGQYAYDDVYQTASDYIINNRNNGYSTMLDDSLSDYENRDSFSYDPEDDPLYSNYRKQYLREGQRATEDALGNYATMTGGLPSTSAVTAATQAGDYYNSQLADVLPELQQLAYEMYMDEGNTMRSDISMYQGLESDAINNARYDQEWNYGVAQDDYAKTQDTKSAAKSELDSILEEGGTPPDELITAAGVSAAYVAAMQMQYQPQYQKQGTSGGGSSGGGNSSGEPDYEGLYSDAYNSPNPANFIASHYKEYGFDKVTGLSGGYTEWVSGGNTISGYADLGAKAQALASQMSRQNSPQHAQYFIDSIENAINDGTITEAEANYLLSAIGY